MLSVVATPIGNLKDISVRGLEVLKEADIIIGEERRCASTLLKRLDIPQKEIYLLNEHSTPSDVDELLELCRKNKVALISDCGTPSFYDPGFQLLKLCRKNKISVTSVPGASSLMTLLSLVSERISSFYFAGFLPADNEMRPRRFTELSKMTEPIVLMDTPYRLFKLLKELDQHFSNRNILLGSNLTFPDEIILEGNPKFIIDSLEKLKIEKTEFILLIYSKNTPQKSKS